MVELSDITAAVFAAALKVLALSDTILSGKPLLAAKALLRRCHCFS